MIEIKQVSKNYAGKSVVDHISLSIKRGQITSLIGPNGAGKSTLLSMMSRIISKDNGEIWIDNKEISKCSSNELAKKISILKQSNHLQIRLTVKDLVSFGRFPYSKGRLNSTDKRFVDEAIAYMELEDLQHQFLDQLSGGQRQRAFIAMVLAQDTEYILLDEPLNNLDMKHSVQIMKVLRKLVDELGKTVVLVLHDINFASCYSDCIIAMKAGKLVNLGDVDKMIQPKVLQNIYDFEIPVEELCGKRICVYF